VKTPREIVEEIAERRRREYVQLVETLRAGGHVTPDTIFQTLYVASKTAGELILDVFADRGGELRPGDDCPHCGAARAVVVRSSRRLKTGWVSRYLACSQCGAKVGKQTVPGLAVPRRSAGKPL